MGKRVYVALAALAVALVSAIVWQVVKPCEPVYKGRTLSSWLEAYATYADYLEGPDTEPDLTPIPGGFGLVSAEQVNAQEAVRQIGTNAIPSLLRFLRARDSAMKAKLVTLARRQHLIKIEYTPAGNRNIAAANLFAILGARAHSALPALIDIANENISPESQSCAIWTLGHVGPPARNVVPALLRWTTNADRDIRNSAIHALGQIDPEAAAKAGIK